MARLHESGFGDVGSTGQRTTGGRAQRVALALLRVCLGVFMFFFGFERASWLLDATPLSTQLASWLVDAAPVSRWYLERLIPGAPVFARLVPLGAMLSGLALTLGFWTRIAAATSLVVVLSLQLGAGSMVRFTYLMDASGLPLVGGLLALVIGGETRAKRKNEERKTNNVAISIRFSFPSLSFQCTCLSQSLFPPEYTPNFFRARSIFQRRYR